MFWGQCFEPKAIATGWEAARNSLKKEKPERRSAKSLAVRSNSSEGLNGKLELFLSAF